jgi:L-rhamnose mutarotase
MKTYCLALDLVDDPELIEKYKWYHRPENIWPEVTSNILSQGVLSEEIYLTGTRMVMILHTTDDFSFEAKAASNRADSRMQEWEALMWKYQKPVPAAKPGEKWVLMEKIFEAGNSA